MCSRTTPSCGYRLRSRFDTLAAQALAFSRLEQKVYSTDAPTNRTSEEVFATQGTGVHVLVLLRVLTSICGVLVFRKLTFFASGGLMAVAEGGGAVISGGFLRTWLSVVTLTPRGSSQPLPTVKSEGAPHHTPISVEGLYSDVLYRPWLHACATLDPAWVATGLLPIRVPAPASESHHHPRTRRQRAPSLVSLRGSVSP